MNGIDDNSRLREPGRETIMPMNRDEAESRLQDWFGFEAFKAGQWEIIQTILNGQSAISIQRTGFGKSICFQFPALCFKGLTLVYSPLIALMRQQTDWLRMRGIPAACINSHQPAVQNRHVLESAIRSQLKILYIAPERQLTRMWQNHLPHLPLSFIVIDEAHCISMWSHDFRSAYRHLIPSSLHRPESIPILAMTATATPDVITDIQHQLPVQTRIIRGEIKRKNLGLNVVKVRSDQEKTDRIIQLVDRLAGHGLVYAMTRANSEGIADQLNRHGISATAYHAGLDRNQRYQVENGFYENQWKCVVTTCALGMGVDKPDIRFIIHTHCPGNLTEYFQEIGRAGRDGNDAFITLFHHPTDRHLQECFIQHYRPEWSVYQAIYRQLEQAGGCLPAPRIAIDLKPELVSMICHDLSDQGIMEMKLDHHGIQWRITDDITRFDYPLADRIRHHKFDQLITMMQYIDTKTCRMNFICRYLGEDHLLNCGKCDNDTSLRNGIRRYRIWKNKIRARLF